jgi:PAS domain S-box-containing protein
VIARILPSSRGASAEPPRSEDHRSWFARILFSFAMIAVLAIEAYEESATRRWAAGLLVAYGLIVVLLSRSRADQRQWQDPPRSFHVGLLIEVGIFTCALTLLGGLQGPLVGLYGLLVLIGGLVGGPRCALQVGSAAVLAYGIALGLHQQLLLPRNALSAHLSQPGSEFSQLMRSFFLGVALVGAMVFATATFSEQVRQRARRAESLYRSLFNAAREPIVVWDPETHEVVDVNRAAVEVAGLPREALIGLGGKAMDLLPREPVSGPLGSSGPGRALRPYVRPDGEERILEASPTAFLDHRSAAVSVVKDVTDAVRRAEEQQRYAAELEQKVAERTRDLAQVNQRLRELQDRAVEAQKLRAVEDLAGSVAHSINNPLQALLGTIELQIESSEEPDSGLQRMLMLAKRIKSVVDSTLDLVRRGSMELGMHLPAEILIALRDELRDRARHQNVSIVAKIEPDVPTILVDRTLLLSALASIAENALEAMPEGGELQLQLEHERTARAVRFAIADSGPGIPEELRRKVLEPFFTTKGGGTGLGLSIASGIIQGHQGNIRIGKSAAGGALIEVQLSSDLSRGQKSPTEIQAHA